jgi:phosphotransferase system  glucose/maltose/N-acetylglucosamine-specific IIC component
MNDGDDMISIDFVRNHVQQAIDHLAAGETQYAAIQLAIIMRGLHNSLNAPIVGTIGPGGKITMKKPDDDGPRAA